MLVTTNLLRRLVYIEPSRKYYARYEGRHCTIAVESDIALSIEEIEAFRKKPDAFMAPEPPAAA